MSDSIKVPCPKCQQKQKLPFEHLGRRITCAGCQHKFWPEILMTCPGCGEGTRVKIESIGRPVLCEHCEHYFDATVSLPCPWCRRTLKIKPRYLGHTFFCKGCDRRSAIELQGTQIVLFPESVSSSPAPPAPPSPRPEHTAPENPTDPEHQLDAARQEVSRLTQALAEEQRRWLEERTALQARHEQDLAALSSANEQLRHELAELRRERDQVVQQLEESPHEPIPSDSGQPISANAARWEGTSSAQKSDTMPEI